MSLKGKNESIMSYTKFYIVLFLHKIQSVDINKIAVGTLLKLCAYFNSSKLIKILEKFIILIFYKDGSFSIFTSCNY